MIGTFKEFLVDIIDLEIPGTHVKALTSASSLVKEVNFSKYEFDKKKNEKKSQNLMKKIVGELTDKDKKK